MSEWEQDVFQSALDTVFHARDSPYAVGTSEHCTSRGVIARVLGLKRKRKRDDSVGRREGDEHASKAKATEAGSPLLEFPAQYDPRYRINVSIVPGTRALQACYRLPPPYSGFLLMWLPVSRLVRAGLRDRCHGNSLRYMCKSVAWYDHAPFNL